MKLKLRKYQKKAVQKVFEFFKNRETGKLLLHSPTGTGKSVMQLFTLELIRQQILTAARQKATETNPEHLVHTITTRISIVRGYITILGYDVKNMSEGKIRKVAESHSIYTYQRYVNLLKKGLIESPKVLIIDEAHHILLGNILSDQIMYDADYIKIIGFTATPFRATPKATIEFLKQWDEVHECISLLDAFNAGYWVRPECTVTGCINDDVLVVRNNEFKLTSMGDLEKCAAETTFETIENYLRECDGARVVSVSSVEIAQELTAYLNAVGVPANNITSKTGLKDRQKALAELEATTHTLVQVNIVNEGFDLPDLAMLIDARPTMSPGLFLQMFGRLTRPSNVRKRYICLCRNLERFAFLLEGILPSTVVYEAQQAFQTASLRSGVRVFGVEKLTRFKPLIFQRSDGIYGSFYLVSHFDSATAKKTMYAVVLQPEKKEPTVFERHDRKVNIDPNNPWKGGYGKWRLSDGVPDDFKGFATEKSVRKFRQRNSKRGKRTLRD